MRFILGNDQSRQEWVNLQIREGSLDRGCVTYGIH